jgi:hypothetical protein
MVLQLERGRGKRGEEANATNQKGCQSQEGARGKRRKHRVERDAGDWVHRAPPVLGS